MQKEAHQQGAPLALQRCWLRASAFAQSGGRDRPRSLPGGARDPEEQLLNTQITGQRAFPTLAPGPQSLCTYTVTALQMLAVLTIALLESRGSSDFSVFQILTAFGSKCIPDSILVAVYKPEGPPCDLAPSSLVGKHANCRLPYKAGAQSLLALSGGARLGG